MKYLLLIIMPMYLLGVDYIKDVKPILDKRCVTCHSCYNSPCQLKLSSFEGLDRGATKALVYDGERLSAVSPTRLFTDAKTTQEWRAKEFFSVTGSKNEESMMLRLLNQKIKNPASKGEYKSEEDLTCAKDEKELDKFLDKHPEYGMPYGFAPLKKGEYKVIEQWIKEGAKGSVRKEVAGRYTMLPPKDLIESFEEFFNAEDAKSVMSARYIYEHLYLAHLTFETKPNEYYELVRSYTQEPEPIDVIPTIRPYDDPKVDKFYYRFRKINSTIVHKTHIVYDLSAKKLQRYKELFTQSKWTQKPKVFGYKSKDNSNPFKVFDQIPAISRYKFLLDNHEYFVRTFIRGPVCKGQIALNVINDHFWLTFMKPEYDLSLKNNGFLKSQYDNLSMPIERGSDMKSPMDAVSTYPQKAITYYIDREKLYDETYTKGLDESSLTGDVVTVYRHFNSASVIKGAWGNLPRTAWVIDYPLLERIYYSLVAGFDIYGNIGHQLSIREYANRLRIEGESYFVNLLPLSRREDIFRSWYTDSNLLKSWYIDRAKEDELYLSKVQSKKMYLTQTPKREILESIIKEFDPINYFHIGEKPSQNGFRSLVMRGSPFTKLANGLNTNLAYIRIKNIPNEEDKVYTAIINRWHDNVMFLLDEESRLDATKDNIDFIEGFVGSYPNLFLVVEYEEFDDFITMLQSYNGSKADIEKFKKYGIFRSDENFWEHFDWFQNEFYKLNPHEAGLFDLNRYYSITP